MERGWKVGEGDAKLSGTAHRATEAEIAAFVEPDQQTPFDLFLLLAPQTLLCSLAAARTRLLASLNMARDWYLREAPVSAAETKHGWNQLTEAERQVAEHVAQGLTNQQVANRVRLSPRTVNSHLRKVFRKLGVSSRVELARLYADLSVPD